MGIPGLAMVMPAVNFMLSPEAADSCSDTPPLRDASLA
jgi:hypothetical protein